MKKRKIISFITILTMILTLALGEFRIPSKTYAKGKIKVAITDIINEDSISTDDGKYLLSQTIEKISNTQVKINLNIKKNNQDVVMEQDRIDAEEIAKKNDVNNKEELNKEEKDRDKKITEDQEINKEKEIIENEKVVIENQKGNKNEISIINTLSDNFEICSDGVLVSGIKNSEGTEAEVTSDNNAIIIKAVDLSSEEINISFEAKVRDNAVSGKNIPVSIKSNMEYIAKNGEKIIGDFPISKLTLSEAGVEEEILEEKKDVEEKTDTEEKKDIEEKSKLGEPVTLEIDNTVNSVVATDSDKSWIDKKAEKVGEGIYEITLTAKGTVTEEVKDSDIILVMDASGSMNKSGSDAYYYKIMKSAVKGFVDDVFKNVKGNKRISIIKFSGPNSFSGTGALSDARFLINLSNDQNAIAGALNNDTTTPVGATNMDAALRQVKTELEGSRKTKPNANRYVIFFTDGIPTTSAKDGKDGSGYGTQINPKWGRVYDTKEELEDDLKDSKVWYKSPVKAAIETYNTIKGDTELKATKVYNILFENFGDGTKLDGVANRLFGEIKGASENGFHKRVGGSINDGNNYSTKNIESLKFIYEEIQNEIVSSNLVLKDANIKDVVSDDFEILKNQYALDGSLNGSKTMTSIITNLNGNLLSSINKEPVINENTISWNVGNISDDGVVIKFRVKPKNDYFGGSDVPTNKEANLIYKDENGNPSTLVFPVPSVDIDYKKGSLTIEKEIVKKNISGEWVKVDNSKISPNDDFLISIDGNQKYTANLKGNSKTSMLFYLKDDNTDISNNMDFKLNYLTVGEFGVEEIVPMNYEQVQILIDKTPNEVAENWVSFEDYVRDNENIKAGKAKNGKIIIDKDNPNINIKVTNTLVNDKYFYDKANAINKFVYTQ